MKKPHESKKLEKGRKERQLLFSELLKGRKGN